MTCKYKRFIVFFFNQQTVIYIQKRFNKRGNYCLDIFQYFLYYMHARNLFDIKKLLVSFICAFYNLDYWTSRTDILACYGWAKGFLAEAKNCIGTQAGSCMSDNKSSYIMVFLQYIFIYIRRIRQIFHHLSNTNENTLFTKIIKASILFIRPLKWTVSWRICWLQWIQLTKMARKFCKLINVSQNRKMQYRRSTAISIKVVPRAKWKSRIRARNAAGNR
jgi:hypothetical protein